MHTIEEKKNTSISDKLISMFDITQDPLYKKIKGKNEEEKKPEWEYVR